MVMRKEDIVDTLYLNYKLKTQNVSRLQLLKAMDWSEGTRQARCIRGENWQVEEVKKLLDLGLTRDDLWRIFFT